MSVPGQVISQMSAKVFAIGYDVQLFIVGGIGGLYGVSIFSESDNLAFAGIGGHHPVLFPLL